MTTGRTLTGVEDGSSPSLAYSGSDDQAQGTAFQRINESTGADNDQSVCAEFFLYAPSDTTFVKHFMSRSTENIYFDNLAVLQYKHLNVYLSLPIYITKFGLG